VLTPLTIVAPDQVTCRHRSRRFTTEITGTMCCQVTPVTGEAGRGWAPALTQVSPYSGWELLERARLRRFRPARRRS